MSFLFRCSHLFVTRFFLGLVCFPVFIVCVFFYSWPCCFVFLCGKDDVLFLNAVERNFQSFNLSSAVQHYS